MANQIVRQRTIGIAREDDATKGTAVALSTGHCVSVEEGILRSEVEQKLDESSVARIEKGVGLFVPKEWSSLRFRAPVKTDWLGHVLTGLLGTVASANAGGETLVREHTLSVSSSTVMPAYTFFMLSQTVSEKATYGTFTKLTLECDAGGVMMAEVEALAQAMESATGTAAFSTDYHFQGSHGSIKIAAAITNLSGASAIAFNKLTLTIEREVKPHHVFGSIEPNTFIGGPLVITGTLELLHTDNTYRDYFTDATDKAMRIAFQNPTTIGSAEKPELTLDLAKIVVTSHEKSEAIDDVDMETITFRAVWDLDESSPAMITNVVLTNKAAATAYTEPA